MSQKKYLLHSLVACEKSEFDKIVKTYLNEIYNFKRIVITDGKDDTGIDLKVFDSGEEKIQYQVTTQKSETYKEKRAFEKKIFADFEKARSNHEAYGYSNTLYFFYSKPLTNKVIREYAKKALSEYGISLSIIEANRIADESKEYLQLQKAIADTNEVERILIDDRIFPDSEKNLIFDLVGFGKTSDFKLQVIESFVLQEILQYKSLEFKQIVDACRRRFSGKENKVFYQKLVKRLEDAKKIQLDASGDYMLTSKEESRLNRLKKKYDDNERTFIENIEAILKEYQQEAYLEEYIEQLREIYVQNYSSDLVELIDKLKTKDLSGLSRDFLNFIQRHFISENGHTQERIKELARKLFICCREDQFLQKFCAGKVFGETSNISRIEKYVNTQKRVFIDTQIALFGLCYYYNPHSNYPNYFYETTKALIGFCQQNHIELNIPDRYLWEVQRHLRDAFNLVPFTFLPNSSKLGRSRNVFFNYYLHLVSNDLIKHSFESFLHEFGFDHNQHYRQHNRLTEKHLRNVGFDIQPIKNYYEIENTSRIIQMDLIEKSKFKTRFNLDNDAIVMEYLSDTDLSVHNQQPIFLSWDKTFFNIQKEYFKKNRAAQRWFLMTPGRFIDQYSLLQFSIDSEVVSSEMIALLTDDIIDGTTSLIDSISFILSNSEISLEYANKLSELRDKEIHRLQEKFIIPPYDMGGEAVIDDMFYKLTQRYQKNHLMFHRFKKVFKDPKLVDKVVGIITKAIENSYQYKRFDKAIFGEFDELIERMK